MDSGSIFIKKGKEGNSLTVDWSAMIFEKLITCMTP